MVTRFGISLLFSSIKSVLFTERPFEHRCSFKHGTPQMGFNVLITMNAV